MLALVLALSVSQVPAVDSPPPLPPLESGQVARSARLVTPREGAGVITGRVAMSTLVGGASFGLATLAGLGVFAGVASSLTAVGGAIALIVFAPALVGIGILGVAVGAALFGEGGFKANFREALTVAGLSVPVAVAVVMVLLVVGVPPLAAIALPMLAATISTPLIVQARKQVFTEPARPATPVEPQGLVFPL
jgi:hypothetical protein